MKSSRRLFLCAGPMLACLCVAAFPAAAQNYKAEKAPLAAPGELSAAVREVLAGEALRVTGPNGLVCEVWLRSAVPVTMATEPKTDIAFQAIAEGTLIGAIRFPSNVQDYRGQPIISGVYTLRYALIPEDGAHMGAAPPQRDFLLLGPPADDASAATVSRDDALDLSRKVTHHRHPTVWPLSPSKLAPGSLPVMTHQEDPDCWLLNFLLALEGGKTLPAALVVRGQTPYS
jgi:hypothetical protein